MQLTALYNKIKVADTIGMVIYGPKNYKHQIYEEESKAF